MEEVRGIERKGVEERRGKKEEGRGRIVGMYARKTVVAVLKRR